MLDRCCQLSDLMNEAGRLFVKFLALVFHGCAVRTVVVLQIVGERLLILSGRFIAQTQIM